MQLDPVEDVQEGDGGCNRHHAVRQLLLLLVLLRALRCNHHVLKMCLDDDGKYDGQVIDNAVHPPELVLEEDLDGFDLHEVLKLLEQTSADHGYEGHPGRVESIEVVPGTPVRVFSEHLKHETKEDEKEGGEMRDAAMDW